MNNLFDKLNHIPRRDLLRLTKQFGVTSTLLAAGGLGGAVTLSRLAEAANSKYEKRFKSEPKVQLKFGGDGHSERSLRIEKSGALQFIQDLEERTEGAIRIEFIGSNQLCNQLTCVKKTQQGIIDLYVSSTQNAAGSAPYFNVLDFAYMFPSRASIYHFLYHPKSEQLLREPLRQRHKLELLFSHAELRGIMLGLKWKDHSTIKSVTELAGSKNRVTGTQLGRIAMDLMKLNPVPIAWSETLDGLKQGLVDGAETWSGAAAWANMAPVISQDVQLNFFAGTQATAMRTQSLEALPADLQDAVRESSYSTQLWVQGHHEAALHQIVGASNPQLPGTIYAENNVRVADLTPEALKEAKEMCSPRYQPKAWEEWRERLNGWSGGQDVYEDISAIAQEVPGGPKALAIDVEPRRWWRA